MKPSAEDAALLSRSEAEELLRALKGWSLKEAAIEREFRFRDFRQAMAFVNQVAAAAEQQDHHPDISISYSRVRLTLTTHKVGGLSRKDFALAALIDRLTDGVEEAP